MKYVKKLKEGELAEGENEYDVNQIDDDKLEHYLSNGYTEATLEEYEKQATVPSDSPLTDEEVSESEDMGSSESVPQE